MLSQVSAVRNHPVRAARVTTLVAVAALASSVALAPLAQAGPVTPSVASVGHLIGDGPERAVIVLLRDQHRDIPDTAQDGHRAEVLAGDQSAVRSTIDRLGGRTTHAYRTLNAVAATVPSGDVAGLTADPSVAAVVPDLPRRLARAVTEPPNTGSAAGPVAPTGGRYAVCPSDPAKPLLEPEALQRTRTSSDDPTAGTARSLGYDGTGVKVAFIADGVDVNQPDLIRADGSHVIYDYQDFSGDGTAASTSGAEALGDASSIAAQGRHAYDLSSFVNPAHRLPVGCTIRVQGMAPGAQVVALKVFPNALVTAPTSTIVQAIDYAVNTDHVDVLNESFGANPYPDTAQDPISIFNRDAVDAGVTVVASTGDAGIGNTHGTAGTDPWVIAAGASTTLRSYAQQTSNGFQLGNGRWADDQVSALSSAGISQTTRVQDLLAPGDLGWALCSARLLPDGSQQYAGCTDDKGAPTDIQEFGGTSQSAPFTAGAAALVVQAYRAGHGGVSPSPQQVRRVLDSSADDQGLPAQEQGAGLLDSYRAVQLARTLDGGSAAILPAAGQLVVDTGQQTPTQLDTVAPAGSPVTGSVTVTNTGPGTQRVTATTRQVSTSTGAQSQTVTLTPRTDPFFIDQRGRKRAYQTRTLQVPVGTDRLLVAQHEPGPGTTIVRLALLDPQGTYTAYSLPQGVGSTGQVDVHQPAPGRWTAILFTAASAAGFAGPVTLDSTTYTASAAGTVSPSSFSLAPGASQLLRVDTTAPASGSSASSVVLTAGFGQTTTVPVVTQAVEQVRPGRPVTVDGTFTAGNGRSFSPAQTDTFLIDVPGGARDLTVDVGLSGTPANAVVAHLVDPTGEPVATDRNERPVGTGSVTDTGVQVVHARPVAGRWQLTLELLNPVTGAALPQTFTATFTLNATEVDSHGLPTGGGVSRRRGTDATVTLVNTGPQPRTVFLDARSATVTRQHLVAVQGQTKTDPFTAAVALPLPDDSSEPAWLVPTQVRRLSVGSSATAPTEFDLMPLDSPTALNAPNNPDIEAIRSGNSATATHTAPEVAPALWAAFPSLVGPFGANPAPAGQITAQADIDAEAFATDWTSQTGDPLRQTVDPTAPTATPVTVPPGGSVTLTLHLSPTGPVGQRQHGTIYLDTLNPYGAAGASGYVDELAALPFSYRISR